jgi:hypothetical protein
VLKNLELQEFYAFLAILITSGANNSNTDNIRDMWQSCANTCAQRMESDSNLAKHYKPTEHLTIDEQLYPYRSRTKFIKYIPSKPAKYGIKVWCDAENSYPLTGQLYTEKSSAGREKNVGERVVRDLVASYKGSGRNITMDNYFTTLPLAKFLLS